MVDVVTGGRGTMPAFAPALSEDEIAAVVDYVRTELSPGGADARPAT